MSDRPKNHGYAAFARADIDDARRGRPGQTLEHYAAARGLEFHGHGRIAGFRNVLPPFFEEQHNLMLGVLPGGRHGVLLHMLLQTHGADGAAIQGTYHRVLVKGGPGFFESLKPDRTDIPFIGAFLNPGTDHSPREAFDVNGAWSPVTTIGIPVPETVSRADGLRLIVAGRAGFISTARNIDLAEAGAPGWRADPGEVARERLAHIIGGPVANALALLSTQSYAEVTVDHGMLTVQRNGYVTDPAELDAFAGIACAIANGLAQRCLDGRRAHSFGEPLAPCRWQEADPKASYMHLPKAWENDFREYANRHGFALEEPRDWHERFPSVPLPGRVLAVMRAPSGERVLFSTDTPVEGPRAVRGAIAFATEEPDTAPGGIASAESGTTTAVRDGVGVVWTHRLFGYAKEADALLDQLRSPAPAVA